MRRVLDFMDHVILDHPTAFVIVASVALALGWTAWRALRNE